MNTIILKGVNIGNNVIIGAGSVVTHDIPDNVVAAGNPCEAILSIDEYYMKRRNAQVQEAKDLVKAYKERYGCDPPISMLHEFFSYLQKTFIN